MFWGTRGGELYHTARALVFRAGYEALCGSPVHLERLSAPGRVAQRNGARWTRRKAPTSWSASAAANMSNLSLISGLETRAGAPERGKEGAAEPYPGD